jgi:light-regulated signal transduction histidine kinase (bacteriophytochrome)
MCNAASRMQALIDGLLLYSRCGTRAQSMSLVDLNQLAQDALSDLETRVQETGAEIHIGPLPTIRADAMQMGQLFQNMLSNGLKFHPAGQTPQLSVSAQVNDEGITLSFTDNGIGIQADQTERIFQVFQRLHGRDEYEGTGVGLSICKKAVDRHDGSIEIESEPGHGTTFVVHLPIAPAVLEPSATDDAPANDPLTGQHDAVATHEPHSHAA